MTGEEFEKIYRTYFQYVYLYLLKLCGNEQLAEELASQTFFKALQAIDRFKGDCEITTWLCQIAKNTYYTDLRKSKKFTSLEYLPEQVECKEFSLEERWVDQDAAATLYSILHHIEEPYKEVFMLRTFGELSFKQIGAIFQKTDNWACVTYHRAKAKILMEMEGL